MFPKSERKFNSSKLLDCDQGHFGIFVKDYHNRSDGSELVWGAVIGLGETFTFTELISFPIFILRNHGETWNNMGYTVWISFIFLAPITIFVMRFLLGQCGVPILEPSFQWGIRQGRVLLSGEVSLREIFYELSLIGFVGTMIEETWHLLYAQASAPVGWQFIVGMVGVIAIPNGWGITQVLLAWASMKNDEYPLCGTGCMRCSGDELWAPVEILSGFSMLFIFGAGMFLGPFCVMAAGTVRLLELQYRNIPELIAEQFYQWYRGLAREWTTSRKKEAELAPSLMLRR